MNARSAHNGLTADVSFQQTTTPAIFQERNSQ
jgi:hypothetical protein